MIVVLSVSLLALIGCQKTYSPAKDIKLLPLFTDNMVLQQKQNIPIWGKAEPGGEVIVTLKEQQQKAIVDDEGNWKVGFSPIVAGGPYELVISGEKTHRIRNVMVGEVWLCSGQSNMDMPLAGGLKIKNYKEEIANANYPNIRLFKIENSMANRPQENFNSEGWKKCSPETVPGFSATAYFFARKLQEDLKIPIGLIESAWGGTMVEAWTSGATLKKIPEFAEIVKRIEADRSTEEEKKLAVKKELAEWSNKLDQIMKNSNTRNHGFQNADYNTDNWKLMKLPTTWEKTGLEYDGVIWFSKDVNIQRSWKGEDLILSLGRINDCDYTWFNGKKVGSNTDVEVKRVYKIPASLVKSGKNRIMIKVLDVGYSGGLYGPAEQMKLSHGDKSISLVGNWKYKIDPTNIDVKTIPERPSQNPKVNNPSVLYNAMIHPLIPYGIRGVIWYQGFSNADRSYQYRDLFKTFIKDWRNLWGEGDFPFLYVQLANLMKVETQPSESIWAEAELREAQAMALELPNTGMAVAIDIGEEDIHPKNKQDVGKRLALIALAKVYGKDIPYSGPMYKSMKVEGNKIRLQFDHVNKGLKIRGGKKLKGFAIAGNDKRFVWAKAKIDGDEVIVWNSKIKNPVAVRYAWAPNPICNLYNSTDLPAAPFRTDDWKGITYGKK
ncbi:MAG: 9-O-acetylesterase [Chlorobi bacterium]|nr:9-O-acetylesterase [Chlorobiota bacterium]